MLSFIHKIKQNKYSDKLLYDALNVNNSDNGTILHNICETTDNQFVINWHLNDDIMAYNHPILFEKDNSDGYSISFLLCKGGLMYLE